MVLFKEGLCQTLCESNQKVSCCRGNILVYTICTSSALGTTKVNLEVVMHLTFFTRLIVAYKYSLLLKFVKIEFRCFINILYLHRLCKGFGFSLYMITTSSL